MWNSGQNVFNTTVYKWEDMFKMCSFSLLVLSLKSGFDA